MRTPLGIVNYYGRFLTNLVTILALTHQWLNKHLLDMFGEKEEDVLQNLIMASHTNT